MRGYGRRVAGVAAFAALLALLLVPVAGYATDAVNPACVAVNPPAAQVTVGPVACEPPAVVDSAAPTDAAGVDPQADAPQDSIDPAATVEPTDAVADDAADTAVPPTAADEQSGAGSQVSSQANPDTRAAIEAVLKVRKRQFDAMAAALQRNIDQLTIISRRLDAADMNTAAARARLAEARSALSRARTAERGVVARFRSVVGSDDESAAYASARAAARASSAQLERARVKVFTAAKVLRAIVKNVTV
jgi:hypothetical protein